MTATTAGLAMGLALMGTDAAAQCVSVDPVIVPDVRIDPLDTAGAAQIVQPVSLIFRRSGVGNGSIHVTYQILDEDTNGQRIGVTAGPEVEWRSGTSARNIGASRNESFTLLRSDELDIRPNKASEQVPVRLFVKNLREDLPAGVYREQFTLRFWCGESERALPVELPGILAVTVQVPNVLSASVAGVSNQGKIDFLDFSTLARSLSVSVRSTGPYAVSARSVNGSALLREGAASEGAADRISYSVAFGGQPVTLNTSPFQMGRAGLEGQQIPLEVKVEDVASKRAGQYSDTLILTLSPIT